MFENLFLLVLYIEKIFNYTKMNTDIMTPQVETSDWNWTDLQIFHWSQFENLTKFYSVVRKPDMWP